MRTVRTIGTMNLVNHWNLWNQNPWNQNLWKQNRWNPWNLWNPWNPGSLEPFFGEVYCPDARRPDGGSDHEYAAVERLQRAGAQGAGDRRSRDTRTVRDGEARERT